MILDEKGADAQRHLLLFAVDALLQRPVAKALIMRAGHPRAKVEEWAIRAIRAAQGVPARPPTDAEPQGYEGREPDPLPEGMLDEIMLALTGQRDVRQAVAAHLQRTKKVSKNAVNAEMTAWAEAARRRMDEGRDVVGDAAVGRAIEQSRKRIIITD